MSSLVIRSARKADLPQVLALDRSVSEAPHWSEANYRSLLQPSAGTLQRRALFVATDESDLQGFAAASSLDAEAELESIVVAAGGRRGGVGTRLLEAVLTWARNEGAHSLMLEVRSRNEAARSFYRARGFRETGVRPMYYSQPAEDAVHLRLDL